MSDKTKLSLISRLIDNHYEFFSSADDAKNSAALEVLVDSIFTILQYDGDDDNRCCHCAEAAGLCDE